MDNRGRLLCCNRKIQETAAFPFLLDIRDPGIFGQPAEIYPIREYPAANRGVNHILRTRGLIPGVSPVRDKSLTG